MKEIHGFSKLNKEQKIAWLSKQFSKTQAKDIKSLKDFWHPDLSQQKIIDDFSENTLSNFLVPFSLAPNFLINDKLKCIPMAIEESSVVAAASKAAKFWLKRGGFKATIHGTVKAGHVHFNYPGSFESLEKEFNKYKSQMLLNLDPLQKNMKNRGGGVLSLELMDFSHKLKNYYALELKAETCDAMGANFINTLLEKIATDFSDRVKDVDVVMAILTNYTDECLVTAEVSCKVDDLDTDKEQALEFAQKFKRAVDIAKVNIDRAVTHNKGIFNGIDAVVMATGNDFRATEASGHAYAARDGEYRSLSDCEIIGDVFSFKLTLPLSLGTIGGLTKLHPIAKTALEILESPNAKELMEIVACVGLAQNFAAVRSLVTTGIQKGHMKMHLLNILNQLGATEDEAFQIKNYFQDKIISFSDVRTYLGTIRRIH